MARHTIEVMPAGERIEAEENSVLSDVLREHGIPLRLDCGGHGLCGKCLVWCNDGTRRSRQLRACQLAVTGDLTVWLPTKTGNAPIFTELYGAPPETETRLGCSVDLGTTNVALEIYDLSSRRLIGSAQFENPQRAVGDDVLSRIAAIGKNPQQLGPLAFCVREKIRAALDKLSDAGFSTGQIVRYTVAGNPAMQQIFLDISPAPLGVTPFTPAFHSARETAIGELGLPGKPDGTVTALPQISGFVGGDAVAGLDQLQKRSKTFPAVLVDLGTNAELALITRDRTVTTSAAAGPAIEGATLQCGVSSRPGAICHVTAGDGRLNLKTIGGGTPCGICGSGYIDLAAELLRAGIVGEDGAFVLDSRHPLAGQLRTDAEGNVEFLLTAALPQCPPVTLTQADIRKLQLAKAAIAAGIEILLEQCGYRPEDIQTWGLAGGIGEAVDIQNAMRVGLLPQVPPDRIIPLGNSSLAGAAALLKGETTIDDLNAIQSRAEPLNLAECAEFSEAFISKLQF